jgi:hypothetical protein
MLVGKVALLFALTVAATAAIASGRLGWSNYWGGFVYAPIALLVAVLLAIALAKKSDLGESSSRRTR